MTTGNATVETISPEMYQVNDILVDFVPKQYSNGQRHMYELDEAGKMIHVSRQYAHDTIEQSIVGAYGGTAAEASDALLADYGHRAHGVQLVAEPIAQPAKNNVVNFRTRLLGERHPGAVRLAKVAASVIALAGIATGFVNKLHDSGTPSERQAVELAVAHTPYIETQASTTTTEAPTTTTEAPTTTTPVSQAEMEARYSAGSTGEHTAHELGFIDIDPNDADKSHENFYSELRHNRGALGFWVSCLESKAPSYAKCVEDDSIVANGEKLAMQYTAMELNQVATVAESVIAKFQNAEFAGISIENGSYKTVAVGADGFIPATNTRFNDPRLNFVFEFNGKKFPVQIRSCVQITENDVPTPPEIVTPPKPPVEIPPTTTTTVPETTTSSTTSSTSSTTTSSTVPETTPTTAKVPPTQPDGEVTTTVTVGDTTPQEPTTSIAEQSTTEPTAPADTATSTTAPEIPVEPGLDNPNMDLVAPLGGIFGTSGLLAALRKRKLAKAKK